MSNKGGSGGNRHLKAEIDAISRNQSLAGELDRSFPALSNPVRATAEAWSPAKPMVGEAHTIASTQTAFAAGQTLELAAQARQWGNEGLATLLEKEAGNSLRNQAPTPPTQLFHRGEIRSLPQTIRTYSNDLHMNNTVYAEQLFDTFCAKHKQRVSRLANKAGKPTKPFSYLAEHTYRLLELEKRGDRAFRLKPTDKTAPFSEQEYFDLIEKLRDWAGPELADIIVDRCKEANIGIISAMRQIYRKLDDDRADEVERCRKFQTQYQWAGSEEDDDDAE